MSSELAIIKAILDKDIFSKYIKFIDKLNLEEELKTIIDCVYKYFKEFKDSTNISVEELNIYFNIHYPAIKNKLIYIELFNKLKSITINNSLIAKTINQLVEKYYASNVVIKLTPVLEGSDFDVLDEVEDILEEYNSTKMVLEKKEDELFVTKDLRKLLDEVVHKDGLAWRLNCLNQDIGELRGCSLGHVFARVDTGKTSFLASEVTHFATQLKDDDVILWFNNEEQGEKVQLRIYQAMLGMNQDELDANMDKWHEEFLKRGGNKLHVIDNAIISVDDIEQMLKEFKVRLIVIDQGDKVKFKGGADMSSHERLKVLYGKFRELAKQYKCDILTAGQASYLAEGRKWLQTDHMDNSKTGKPGELDYAIGIGKIHENFGTGLDDLRYIKVCKNKMHRGHHGQYEVFLDTAVARYMDGMPEGRSQARPVIQQSSTPTAVSVATLSASLPYINDIANLPQPKGLFGNIG